jgi:hypothetical protein
MGKASYQMDARAIYAILQTGKIGEMPFPLWLELTGRIVSLDMPDYPAKPVPQHLSDLGAAVRWEPGDSNPDPQRLWQAYLVVTLPTLPPYSLKLIHDIAVEVCGSYYYSLKDNELWIEYLVARPDVRDEIEKALVEGKIGELPFPMWFRYFPASTSIENIANVLAAYGVTAARWEADKYENSLGTHWQAYLVATLPISSSVSPPSLPSERLVSAIGMALRSPDHVTTYATNTAVEMWVSYSIELPLGNPPGRLVHEDGLTYVSFALDDAPTWMKHLRRAFRSISGSTQPRK